MTVRKLKIGCYGKLPFYKEYISFGLEGVEPRAFKELVDKGEVQRGLTRREADINRLPKYFFLFHPSGARNILIGTLFPSSDGLRPFPMAPFCSIPRKRILKFYHMLPIYFEEVWNSFDAFISQDFVDIRDFYEKARQIELHVNRTFHDIEGYLRIRLEQTPVHALCPRAGPVPEEWPDWGLRVFKNLRICAQTEQGRKKGDISLAFSIPVWGNREHRFFLVCFWLTLIRAVLRGIKGTPSVLFSDGEGLGSLHRVFILYRPIQPLDFVAMMEPEKENDFISNLASDWGQITRSAILSSSLVDTLKSPKSSLQDILNSLRSGFDGL